MHATTWKPVLLMLMVFASVSGFFVGCHQNRTEEAFLETTDMAFARHAAFQFAAVQHTLADVYAAPDSSSDRLTQCMFGDVVRIDDELDWWYAVKVGPAPELAGWMHKSEVIVLPADAIYIKERNLTTIVIRQNGSEILVWPSQNIPIPIGTELPFMGESNEWYLVRLPNNDVGKITRKAVEAAPLEQQPLIQIKEAAPPVTQGGLAQRQEIIDTAQHYLGKVYAWGGTTPRGFDCSGLTYFVYRLNGIELPRLSWLQYRTTIGKKITKSRLNEADLVFFETYRPGPSHVGIYIGNNQFIHASPKYGVTIGNLDDPYFKTRYIGAKSVLFSS